MKHRYPFRVADHPAVVAERLSRSFGNEKAVRSVTMDISAGEIMALLGPNGAGKTTTVRILDGVLRPDTGRCLVLGIDPSEDPTEVRRRTGVMTENSNLDDRLTALENVAYHARIRGFSRTDADRRGMRLLEALDMAGKAGQTVGGFSTGQRRRVSLARALVHEPEVLFLDEPTSGLDPEATRRVLDIIVSQAKDHGRAVLLATHFLPEAGRVSDRIAVMRSGTLLAAGTPEELASRLAPGLPVTLDLGGPASAEVMGLLASSDLVLAAEPSGDGADIQVVSRDALPSLVSVLVSANAPVYAVTPLPATVEDIYFAVMQSAPQPEGEEQ